MSTFHYSLNDVTDPTAGHGTQQPLYYDQLKAMYKKAVVVGARVFARVHNGGSASVMVGVIPAAESQSNTALDDFETYMELPRCKSKLLSPDVDHTTLGHAVSIKKHFGLRNLKDEDGFHCDLPNEGSPTRVGYWHFFCRPVDRTTTVTVEWVVTLEYIVLLLDRITPARSSET